MRALFSTMPAASRFTRNRWAVDLCRPRRWAMSLTRRSGSSAVNTPRIATARSMAWMRYAPGGSAGPDGAGVASAASVVCVVNEAMCLTLRNGVS